MGSNYYRVPTSKEMFERQQRFNIRMQEIDVIDPGQIEGEFRTIQVNDWEWQSPWDEFLDGTKIHLGKRSSGWKFCWNFHNNKYYSNKEELLKFIRSGRVVDEYGTAHGVEEFIEMALDWGSDRENGGWTYNEEYIIAQFDEKGLARPFTATEKYYDLEIDGLRVSSATEFS